MRLSEDKVIDWSHEREWRWTKNLTSETDPGLVIWAEDEDYPFSEIVLIVQTEEEATALLNQLKTYADHPLNRVSFEMSRRAVERTKILALDLVEDRFRSDPMTRLEDLPAVSLQEFTTPTPSPETLRRVRAAVEKTRETAQRAAWERPSGGLFGFGWVVTYDAQSEITQALMDLGYARVSSGRGYQVTAIMEGVDSLFIDTVEAAATAAAKTLTEELGQPFYPYSMLD